MPVWDCDVGGQSWQRKNDLPERCENVARQGGRRTTGAALGASGVSRALKRRVGNMGPNSRGEGVGWNLAGIDLPRLGLGLKAVPPAPFEAEVPEFGAGVWRPMVPEQSRPSPSVARPLPTEHGSTDVAELGYISPRRPESTRGRFWVDMARVRGVIGSFRG